MVGACALLVCILLLAYTFSSDWREERALVRELQDFAPPSVLYEGVRYYVLQGTVTPQPPNRKSTVQILRIARFAVEARIAPVFGLAGVDPALMSENIDAFERSTIVLEEYQPPSNGSVPSVLSDLYPLMFLREMAQLESARKSLLETPSSETVAAYEERASSTIAAYHSFTEQLQHQFARYATTSVYAVWNGTIRAETFVDALEQLTLEAQEAAYLLQDRARCYAGQRRACMPLAETFAAAGVARRHVTDASSAPEPMPEKVALNLSLFESYRPQAQTKSAITYGERDPKQPVVLLRSSACFPQEEQLFATYWLYQGEAGDAGVRVEFLNDIFFNTYDDTAKNPVAAYFRARDITFEHQSSGNYYLCPEMGDDIGRVMALYAIRTSLGTRPLADAFATLEARIREEEVLDEGVVSAYIKEITETLSAMGERGFEERFGSGSVAQAYTLLALWDQQSAGMEYALGTMAHYNYHMRGILSVFKPDPWYTLSLRSYLSFLLFPYNTSVASGSSRISLFAKHDPENFRKMGIETYAEGRFSDLTPLQMLHTMQENRLRVYNALRAAYEPAKP